MRNTLIGALLAAAVSACSAPAHAQVEFERDPINYGHVPTRDRVARLQHAIEQGDVALEYDEDHGYLKSLLHALDIPIQSQTLVFSKTSFQLRRISPSRPRAVYANDDTYGNPGDPHPDKARSVAVAASSRRSSTGSAT